jgi:hypothetical protein
MRWPAALTDKQQPLNAIQMHIHAADELSSTSMVIFTHFVMIFDDRCYPPFDNVTGVTPLLIM